MNSTAALLCGLAATLLLALGLSRAAERFDPIMQPATELSSEEVGTQSNLPCLPSVEPA